ncbi:hypothetical protein CRN61_09190 [Vibrio vulnificus]|nr:hypothetical protein SC81_19580 [Vibrio vulnificus]POC08822.1 hypothetical protein CRN54_16010 [Vibrio vulnificus]POC79654.1 hypothetical protein CRN61_09190 [Vibrio vulnificus]
MYMSDWDIETEELLNMGDVGDQKALAEIVLGADGQVLVKYGDNIRFIPYNVNAAAEISADLLALIVKARKAN